MEYRVITENDYKGLVMAMVDAYSEEDFFYVSEIFVMAEKRVLDGNKCE